jgi:hypothetical protein
MELAPKAGTEAQNVVRGAGQAGLLHGAGGREVGEAWWASQVAQGTPGNVKILDGGVPATGKGARHDPAVFISWRGGESGSDWGSTPAPSLLQGTFTMMMQEQG